MNNEQNVDKYDDPLIGRNIIQLDGNVSLSESLSSSNNSSYDISTSFDDSKFSDESSIDESSIDENEDNINNISVIVGHRPFKSNEPRNIKSELKTVIRNTKGQVSLYLPNIAVYNHRSIWAKIKNFATEFNEMKIGVAFNSEIWENKEKKSHQFQIERLCELKEGLCYISTPRPDRRGGGAALIVDNKKFHVKRYNPTNVDNLEVTFAILRPKEEECDNLVIILCALYSPPNSR